MKHHHIRKLYIIDTILYYYYYIMLLTSYFNINIDELFSLEDYFDPMWKP